MRWNRSWTAAAVLLVLVVVVAAACGSDDPTLGQGGAGCTPGGTALAISANDLKFDKTCLAAPADQDFTIAFDNEEALPHNVAIRNKAGDGDLFYGEVFSGPKVVTYTLKGLPSGTYRFWCSVHPSQMQGNLVVQ